MCVCVCVCVCVFTKLLYVVASVVSSTANEDRTGGMTVMQRPPFFGHSFIPRPMRIWWELATSKSAYLVQTDPSVRTGARLGSVEVPHHSRKRLGLPGTVATNSSASWSEKMRSGANFSYIIARTHHSDRVDIRFPPSFATRTTTISTPRVSRLPHQHLQPNQPTAHHVQSSLHLFDS